MFFFLNDPPTPEIYTLPHHPPLPITYASADPPITYPADLRSLWSFFIVINSQYSYTLYDPLQTFRHSPRLYLLPDGDRKSTRLNSSHANISYAVFCLKKKNHIIMRSVL